MNKVSQIFIVIGAVAMFIVLACILGFTGVKNIGYNYVRVEVNPKVEFLSDSKNKIVTFLPINSEAKTLIAKEDFVGLDIEEGVKKFVDLCVKCNYIDIDREDNALKLTVVSGLTQSLDVKVTREVNKYILDNNIKCVVLDNSSDLGQYNRSKKFSVSPNKYSLMESLCNLDSEISLNEASKLSESKMLKKIYDYHKALMPNVINYSETELNDKEKLINENYAKLEYHKENLDNKSRSKFKDEYTKYSKLKKREYQKDFEMQYDFWKEYKDSILVS